MKTAIAVITFAVAAISHTVEGQIISIDLSTDFSSDQSASVGETVKISFPEDYQSIYLHPGGGCNPSEATEVGTSSPVMYSFTEEDSGRELTFATAGEGCDLGNTVNLTLREALRTTTITRPTLLTPTTTENLTITTTIPMALSRSDR